MAKSIKIKTKKGKVKVGVKQLEWLSDSRWAIVICGFFFVAYYLYSLVSNGYYQQDELAHYLSMRVFWKDPNSILSNWAKPGYKLILIWPALLGVTALKLFNIALSVAIGYMAFITSKKVGVKYPLLALLLLLTQPFWIQLSFRNYSEHLTAFCYLLGVFFLIERKYLLTALVISYGCFLRQETYPIALLFAGYMIYHKRLWPVILLMTFPLLQNVWGWASTGNPSYLIDMMVGTSAEYASMYPRQGFEHYFLMSPVIFGYLVTLLSVGYIVGHILERKMPPTTGLYIWIPLLTYAAQHVVFNSQFLDIGPSTGGNLRYFNVIAPLASICAVMGLEVLIGLRSSKLALLSMGILATIIIYYTSYDHNYIKYTEMRNWIVALSPLALMSIWYFISNTRNLIIAIMLLSIVQVMLMVHPLKISSEDALAKSTAQYIVNTSSKRAISVASAHATCSYFLYDHVDLVPYNKGEMAKMNPGDWIIWDSHYSARNKIEYQELVDDKENYEFVKQDITDDKRFATLLFQRK